jgi:hypothetical protein
MVVIPYANMSKDHLEVVNETADAPVVSFIIFAASVVCFYVKSLSKNIYVLCAISRTTFD